jgi:hypothetical protein
MREVITKMTIIGKEIFSKIPLKYPDEELFEASKMDWKKEDCEPLIFSLLFLFVITCVFDKT